MAVIGSGMAGLSCATQLKASGFEVQVYEKSYRASGRMSTRNTGGWSADHGAQYFTARDPLFIAELNTWEKAGVVAAWEPHLKVFQSNQWTECSSEINRYVGIPGMGSIGQYLAKNLLIEFNQTINLIDRLNGKWLLQSLESGDLQRQFDWLILALPAPQAFALLDSIDPLNQVICTKAVMQGCWTVMVRFTQKPNIEFDAAFVNNEMISWISRNNSKPGRVGQESWTIHANPQWSQENIEMESAEATRLILDCAKKLGLDCQHAEVSSHRWRYASGCIEPAPESSLNTVTKLGLWAFHYRSDWLWLRSCSVWRHYTRRAISQRNQSPN